MSALGQMSAFGGITDIANQSWNVRFWPLMSAMCQKAVFCSLCHLSLAIAARQIQI